MERRAAGAVAFAVLLVVSIMAPIGMVGAADAAPSGFSQVPDGNVGSDLPPNTPMGEAADELAETGVYATDHEDSLDVTVTNPGRAKNKYSGGHVSGGGPVAIVFGDDDVHEGREVAIDADVLEDAVGDRPNMTYGAHESGDEWRSEVRYEDGLAIFEIPEFSENTVTFSGTVNITGDPADDGASWSYDLDSVDEIGDPTVEVTGHENRENETTSETLGDGDSLDVDVDGSTDPEAATLSVTGTVGDVDETWRNDSNYGDDVDYHGGYLYTTGDGAVRKLDASDGSVEWEKEDIDLETPIVASDDHVIVQEENYKLTALDPSDGSEVWSNEIDDSLWYGFSIEGDHFYAGNTHSKVHKVNLSDGSEEWESTVPTDNVRAVAVNPDDGEVYMTGDSGYLRALDDADGSELWSKELSDERHAGLAYDADSELAVAVEEESGLVRAIDVNDESEEWTEQSDYRSWYSVDVGDGYAFVGNYDNEIKALSLDDGHEIWEVTDPDSDVDGLSYGNGQVFAAAMDYGVAAYDHVAETRDVTVEQSGTTLIDESGTLEDGETVSSSADLSLGSSEFDVTTSDGTVANVDVEVEEITETVDPEISVNGYPDSYDGTLDDGETAELDVDPEWIEEGTNNVSIAVSEDVDGPTGQTGLDYSHDASDEQSVDYTGEKFSERYTVGKTFASEQEDATLSVRFDGNVIEIRTLEQQVNGSGDWNEVSEDDYSVKNGTLTVELGDVSTNESRELEVVGSKVRPVDGEISVTDPTPLGSDLSTEIEIVEMGDDFEIEVGETPDGDRVHHTYSESWTNAQAYTQIAEDGDEQSLRFPNAGNGETTRLGTIPLEVVPNGGHSDVRVTDAGEEPEFAIRDTTSASDQELIWHDTESGQSYALYSVSDDRELERETAESPVTFEHDADDETLTIFEVGSGDDSGPVVAGGASSDGLPFSLDPLVVMLGSVAALGGLLFVSRRFGGSDVRSTLTIGVGAVVVLLVAIQSFAPEVFGELIAEGISEAIPLIVIGAIALIILWLRSGGGSESVVLNIEGDT